MTTINPTLIVGPRVSFDESDVRAGAAASLDFQLKPFSILEAPPALTFGVRGGAETNFASYRLDVHPNVGLRTGLIFSEARLTVGPTIAYEQGFGGGRGKVGGMVTASVENSIPGYLGAVQNQPLAPTKVGISVGIGLETEMGQNFGARVNARVEGMLTASWSFQPYFSR